MVTMMMSVSSRRIERLDRIIGSRSLQGTGAIDHARHETFANLTRRRDFLCRHRWKGASGPARKNSAREI